MKKVGTISNYIEQLLTLFSVVIGCTSISTFAFLISASLGLGVLR